uniref:Uncharacterized protein n=1 Tax=Amphimedon queenslandica TaxID=400682 RepID=A0A1X7TK67_AMPQE
MSGWIKRITLGATIPYDSRKKGAGKSGPLSISGEVAHAINLSGLREVCIRRVDKDEVTLDLVEFIFKIDKGVYISRKLLFAGMLLRVSGLWTKGETVKSGVHGVIPQMNSVKGVRPLIERYRTHNSSRTSTSLHLMLPKTRAKRTRLVT